MVYTWFRGMTKTVEIKLPGWSNWLQKRKKTARITYWKLIYKVTFWYFSPLTVNRIIMPGSKRKNCDLAICDNDHSQGKRHCQGGHVAGMLPMDTNGASSVQPMQCSFPDASGISIVNNGSHSSQNEPFQTIANSLAPSRPPGLVPLSPRRCLKCLSGESGHINHILA